MENWANLPAELLAHLYSFLSRRDRLSCSLVCKTWKKAMDHVALWSRLVVYLDIDLQEPSTVLLIRDYARYIKRLELGWSMKYSTRFCPEEFKELTKRMVRFFSLLHDNYIQISCLRIFNWFEFFSFHKVVYHLTRFLKSQIKLNKLIFDNININSHNCIKTLSACLNAKSAITSLDIKNCYYCVNSYDFLFFRTCLEQMTHLQTFKIDYSILSCKVIDSILVSNNSSLEYLEIILKDKTRRKTLIEDVLWSQLCSACPKLKVAFVIQNLGLYNDLRQYLKRPIPIVTLSIIMPYIAQKDAAANFLDVMNLIIRNYSKTLVVLDLQMKNHDSPIDDQIMNLIRNCPLLHTFCFYGVLETPAILERIFVGINYFWLMPNEFERLVCCRIQNQIYQMNMKLVKFIMQRAHKKVKTSLLVCG